MEGGSAWDLVTWMSPPIEISRGPVQPPMSKVTNPRTAFNRLFASFNSTLNEEVEQRQQRLSVLDFVLTIFGLQPRLNARTIKNDEYLTAVRGQNSVSNSSMNKSVFPVMDPVQGEALKTKLLR